MPRVVYKDEGIEGGSWQETRASQGLHTRMLLRTLRTPSNRVLSTLLGLWGGGLFPLETRRTILDVR